MEIPDFAGSLFSEDISFYHQPQNFLLNSTFQPQILNNDLFNNEHFIMMKIEVEKFRVEVEKFRIEMSSQKQVTGHFNPKTSTRNFLIPSCFYK